MNKETPDPPDRRSQARIQNDGAKRMPHERDEAPGDKDNEPRGVMKQAASDLAEGLVDTDLHGQRGVEQAVQHGGQGNAQKSSGQAQPQADAAEGMRHQNSTTPPIPPKGSKQ